MSARFLIFLAAYLSAPAALAGDVNDGFSGFRAACGAEFKPEWAPELKTGRLFTRSSVKNLADLREMTDVVCPAYLAHRNDGNAIRRFTAKKIVSVDTSPVVERVGNRLLRFLETEFAAQHAAFAELEIDFAATRCGQHMQATEQRVKARLQKIKEATAALTAKCFQLNDQLDAKAQAKGKSAYDAKVERLPANAQAPGGQAAGSRGSDITGVREDKAKRR